MPTEFENKTYKAEDFTLRDLSGILFLFFLTFK